MSEDLRGKLARAKEMSGALRKAADEMNQTISRFEQKLVALNLGVSAGYEFVDDDSRPLVLWFKKHDGAWALCVELPNEQVMPLAKTSRAIRVECCQRFGMLLEALAEAVEKDTAGAVVATQDAEAAIRLLEGK